jgi:ornithine cyclodeaminase/alanine dehydrogenase-like protein (mu-crystallin family)
MANALFLDEQTVKGLVGVPDALAVVEEVFRKQGKGNVVNVPRVRAPVKGGTLRMTAALLSYRGYYGVKISPSRSKRGNFSGMMCID